MPTPRRNPYPGVYRRGKTFAYYLDGPPTLETVTDPETGEHRIVERRKQITKSGFPTAKAAWEARQQREAELAAGVNVNPSHATLAAYMRAWLDGRHDIKDSTWVIYDGEIKRRIAAFAIGSVPLQKLTPLHVSSWLRDLAVAGYATQTINTAYNVLNGALKQAVAWGMVPRHVASLVRPPTIQTPEMETWTPEQMTRFLARSDQDDHAPLWRLALMIGLRRGELLALRWSDIDLERATLSVHRTMTINRDRRVAVGSTAKSPSSRRQIALPALVVTQLKAHQDRLQFVRQKAGSLWVEQGFVFCGPRGNRRSHTWLRKHQFRLMQAAGVPEIPLHGFRHTAATFALVMGEHPRQVQTMLGHASVAITLDRYSHVTNTMQADYAGRIEAALEAVAEAERRKQLPG